MDNLNKLLKLLRNNQGRGVKAEAKVDGDEATIWLYGVIGYDWLSDSGIVAVDFVKELADLNVKTIHLRINSPGGSPFDAQAMKVALEQHPAQVISYIDSLAASAASIVALAGDEIEIAEGGFFMIHKAMGLAIGNSDDMTDMAERLEKVDGVLAADYQKKSGQKKAQIEEWMKAETWFTAQEALDAGFADKIFEGKEAENRFDLSVFENAPEMLQSEKASVEKTEASELAAKEESDEDLNDATRDKRERKLAFVKRGI